MAFWTFFLKCFMRCKYSSFYNLYSLTFLTFVYLCSPPTSSHGSNPYFVSPCSPSVLYIGGDHHNVMIIITLATPKEPMVALDPLNILNWWLTCHCKIHIYMWVWVCAKPILDEITSLERLNHMLQSTLRSDYCPMTHRGFTKGPAKAVLLKF